MCGSIGVENEGDAIMFQNLHCFGSLGNVFVDGRKY